MGSRSIFLFLPTVEFFTHVLPLKWSHYITPYLKFKSLLSLLGWQACVIAPGFPFIELIDNMVFLLIDFLTCFMLCNLLSFLSYPLLKVWAWNKSIQIQPVCTKYEWREKTSNWVMWTDPVGKDWILLSSLWEALSVICFVLKADLWSH